MIFNGDMINMCQMQCVERRRTYGRRTRAVQNRFGVTPRGAPIELLQRDVLALVTSPFGWNSAFGEPFVQKLLRKPLPRMARVRPLWAGLIG